jgi:hypothetical protein
VNFRNFSGPFFHAIWRIVLRTKGADSKDGIGFVVGVCAEDRCALEGFWLPLIGASFKPLRPE